MRPKNISAAGEKVLVALLANVYGTSAHDASFQAGVLAAVVVITSEPYGTHLQWLAHRERQRLLTERHEQKRTRAVTGSGPIDG